MKKIFFLGVLFVSFLSFSFSFSSSLSNSVYMHASGGSQIIIANSHLGNISLFNSSCFIGTYNNFKLFILPVFIVSCACVYLLYRSAKRTIANNNKTSNKSSSGKSFSIKTIEGSGVTETRKIELPSNIVDYIRVLDSGTLIIQQIASEGEFFTISAYDNILPLIIYAIDDNCLTISLNSNVSLINYGSIIYTVYVKNIKKVYLDNDVKARTCDKSVITAEALDLAVKDSSKARLRLRVQNLIAEVSDSSSLKLILKLNTQLLTADIKDSSSMTVTGGAADEQKIVCKDSSRYNALKLSGVKVVAEVEDSSSVTINVSDRLEYKIRDSSNVKYKGTPQLSGTKKNSSSIKRIG